MKIPSLFKKKLRDNRIVWCIGVPYTEKQFKDCISLNSDFIVSLSKEYKTSDTNLLWKYYKKTANLIRDTVVELASRNVKIVQLYSANDIKNVLCFENIIITAHHHSTQLAMEFMGRTVPIRDFIENISSDYSGTIDVSSCYSATFLQELELQASNAHFIAINTASSLDLRIFIYKHTVKLLTKNNQAQYLDAYKSTLENIVSFNRILHNKTPQKIMLGNKPQSVSVFAPQNITKGETMMVQVFLYLDEEYKKVKVNAIRADEFAAERGNCVLDLNVKAGDKVQIELNILGLEDICPKQFIWQNRFNRCSFFVEIPKDYNRDKILGEVFVSVNGAIIGEVDFYTQITAARANEGYAPTTHYQNRKTFISYAHEDKELVRIIHMAYESQGIDHFYDRANLRPGDIFPEEIQNYIKNEATLFILCWSRNAENSEYVRLERQLALSLAYPQQPRDQAKLQIKPYIIAQYDNLPADMRDIYHFKKLTDE